MRWDSLSRSHAQVRDRSGCCSHLFVCTRPPGCASCPLTAHSFSCHPLNVAPSCFLPPHAVTLLTGSIIQRPGWGFHTALPPPTLTHTRSASTHTHSPSVTQTPTALRNARLFSSSRFYLANTCPFLHFPPLCPHIFTITKINLLSSRFYIRHLQVQCVTCPSH